MTKPLTILIHGLYMSPKHLRALDNKVRAAGFRTHLFGYVSWRQSVAQAAQSLHHWLLAHHHPHEPINLVGHSLGGLVIRQFLAQFPQWRVHRVVTLGTPHRGSACAKVLHRHFAPSIRAAFVGALDGNCPTVVQNLDFGVIAGNKPVGLGSPIFAMRQKTNAQKLIHDGTVTLAESRFAAASDYIVLPVSHSGMLLDHQVAQQVVQFLQTGRFSH